MNNRGCTVFVGNIDFDVPEDKLIEELSAVGRVVGFRMVVDRTTGKSKGYGFCTYESPIIADMAVNKLKIQLNNRAVKINYADNNPAPYTVQEESKLNIENLVESLEKETPEAVKEILKHLKQIGVNRPAELKTLLKNNPNLLCTVLHLLFILGLIPKSELDDLVYKSFSVPKQSIQIFNRILQYHDYEVEQLPEELKQKAKKIRERALKKSR
ncbi:cleavage stimulation factor subunit 2 [Nematocida sp. AWRm80]|nr:cleavage stimulation factor subunit 2 [Nematocida sp. AWRm80]